MPVQYVLGPGGGPGTDLACSRRQMARLVDQGGYPVAGLLCPSRWWGRARGRDLPVAAAPVRPRVIWVTGAMAAQLLGVSSARVRLLATRIGCRMSYTGPGSGCTAGLSWRCWRFGNRGMPRRLLWSRLFGRLLWSHLGYRVAMATLSMPHARGAMRKLFRGAHLATISERNDWKLWMRSINGLSRAELDQEESIDRIKAEASTQPVILGDQSEWAVNAGLRGRGANLVVSIPFTGSEELLDAGSVAGSSGTHPTLRGAPSPRAATESSGSALLRVSTTP